MRDQFPQDMRITLSCSGALALATPARIRHSGEFLGTAWTAGARRA